MSVEKTKITPASGISRSLTGAIEKVKVLFLGTEIYRPSSRNNNQPATKLALLIPIKLIVEKLAAQQFCIIKDYAQGQIKPMGKPSWINLELAEILRRYNSVLQGIINYYSFATNRARLQFIQFILLHSCVKLFGRKLKLNSRKSVFSKFDSNLTVKDKNGKKVSFKLHHGFKATGKFLINPKDRIL